MATINAIQCGTDVKNTGLCDCFLDPKLLVGAILIPKTRVLTQAEVTAIQATLEGLTITTKGNRIFPIQNFVAVTDSSEEPVEQTFGYGVIEPVREGKYNLIFQFRQGGVQLSNGIRSFNGLTAKYAVLFIESQNILIGTRKLDVDGNDGLAGIPLDVIYAFPWKVNDGTNLASYRIKFVFQPQYVNENISFAKIDTTEYLLTELAGLEDVNLTVVEIDNDTVTIKAVTECGADLYDDFADELAQVTAWVIRDENGDLLTASAVVKNDGAAGWDVTFPATIVDGSTASLAAPTVLDANPINVSGYESDVVTIQVGS